MISVQVLDTSAGGGADGVVREARVERQIKGGGPGGNDGKRLERSITATTALGGEHLLGFFGVD